MRLDGGTSALGVIGHFDSADTRGLCPLDPFLINQACARSKEIRTYGLSVLPTRKPIALYRSSGEFPLR
jgi:hypothetical protein